MQDLTRICIIGAGVGGSVLAMELSKIGAFKVTLIDTDTLKKPFKKIFLVSKIIEYKIFDLFNRHILVEVFPMSPTKNIVEDLLYCFQKFFLF